MSFVRTFYWAIFILLIQVQRKSHSQYYPPPPQYPHPRHGNTEQFDRRDLQPSYRQHQHYYHVYQEPVAYEYQVGTPPILSGGSGEFYEEQKTKYGDSSTSSSGSDAVRLSFYNDRMEITAENGNTFRRSKIKTTDPPMNGDMRPGCPRGDQRIFRGDGKCYQIYGNSNRPCGSYMRFFPERDNPNYGDCGCPDDHKELVFRKHKDDGKCYQSLSKGHFSPCGRHMKFYPSLDGIHGECDCDVDNGIVSRPLAYWRPHDSCYLLFHRGPCSINEWLVLDKEGQPKCVQRSRKCSSDDSEASSRFAFLHNDKCYETGKYYPEFCGGERSKKVYFPNGEHVPKCLDEEPKPNGNSTRTLLTPATDLRCKPGYKKMQNGECKRKATFDYDYYR